VSAGNWFISAALCKEDNWYFSRHRLLMVDKRFILDEEQSLILNKVEIYCRLYFIAQSLMMDSCCKVQIN
jgi:hypothetical protein